MFNMIAGINESKTLNNHISCECKYEFDQTKCELNQWWNNYNCWCECKKYHICEKEYVWNRHACICENGKYLESIMDDLVTTCDVVTDSYDEEIKTVQTNFNEKNVTCRTLSFYILLTFLLITISLLIAISICCYLIKYRAKQKHLLPLRGTKLKQFCVGSINWK